MSENPTAETSTPAATAAAAQTHDEAVSPEVSGPIVEVPAIALGRRGVDFEIGKGVARAQWAYAEPRNHNDPTYREVSIYTIDPSASRDEGNIARVRVNYEPLEPGPVGAHFRVNSFDADRDKTYAALDLDHPRTLITQGRKPSPSDPQFHQQMTYTVCSHVYDAFHTALGRHPAWGFDKEENQERNRLEIFPFGMEAQNAYYERSTKSLKFGYYAAKEATGRNVRNGWVFTALSHDIIVHEVTHAFLDGMRSDFLSPTNPDVLAFHEAFADIVAVFQRFSYETVVEEAIRKARGAVDTASVLTDLARQFGNTIGKEGALRTTNDLEDSGKARRLEDAGLEPHDRGSVLTSAVYAAFTKLFAKKTRRFLLLATNGTGILPDGEIAVQLREVLAKEASRLASHCLTICIRAIDYCPPVDVEFGEYLRAIITADYDLVPDDHWGYREAWVDAFWERGIYPRGVANLTEDALLWRKPRRDIIVDLNFGKLAFPRGENGAPMLDDLEEQASILGACVTSDDLRKEFGLAKPGKDGDSEYGLPTVQSLRTSRRVGPDHQVAFDLVAEVTQKRTIQRAGRTIEFVGGATIIIGPHGDVRYVISKRVDNDKRLDWQLEFMTGTGSTYWTAAEGALKLSKDNLLKMVHGGGTGRFGLAVEESRAVATNAHIEMAKSARSKCRVCDEEIAKNELRFAERVSFDIVDSGTTQHFYHLRHAAAVRPAEFLAALAAFKGDVSERESLQELAKLKLRELEDFVRDKRWQRNHKGNWVLRGATPQTMVYDSERGYNWAVGKSFGDSGFLSFDEAKRDLWRSVASRLEDLEKEDES